MNKEGVIQFFPVRLERGAAPEASAADAARMLENVDVSTPGRIKRRLGLALSNVDGVGYTVTSCFYCERADGVGMLFYGDAGGNLYVSLNPAEAWTDGDEFEDEAFNEQFNEEGE